MLLHLKQQIYIYLLNFKYSLITEKGELLKFSDGEDKIPRLILPYKLFKLLNVKKKIHKTNYSKNKEDDISKIQNDLKSSIKDLYISDQKTKKKKTIDEYAQLTKEISDEYAKLRQENNRLKLTTPMLNNYLKNLIENHIIQNL